MVMWARQIERRVEECLGRVKLLLGEDWEQGMEGKALKEKASALCSRVDTTERVKQWEEEMKGVIEKHPLADIVFSLHHNPASGYTITVNYNEDYLSLFKEVRTLQCLDVHPPIRLRVECDSAKGCYSNMTAVRSALLMYE
ncbi:hypothetical protein WA577_002461, partial [Blastocystis sp. JDR]